MYQKNPRLHFGQSSVLILPAFERRGQDCVRWCGDCCHKVSRRFSSIASFAGVTSTAFRHSHFASWLSVLRKSRQVSLSQRKRRSGKVCAFITSVALL